MVSHKTIKFALIVSVFVNIALLAAMILTTTRNNRESVEWSNNMIDTEIRFRESILSKIESEDSDIEKLKVLLQTSIQNCKATRTQLKYPWELGGWGGDISE